MTLLDRIVRLSEEVFSERPVFSFVGGSYATGRQSPTSDVDIFVLLRRSEPILEREFAHSFLEAHKQWGVPVPGHCGEVITTISLESLLRSVEQTISTVPEILSSACYHSDCILSAFRKGDVLMKFLADPKICFRGDAQFLGRLEQRAVKYFATYEYPRVQLDKDEELLFRDGSQLGAMHHQYSSLAHEGNPTETPAGIELDRWFASLGGAPKSPGRIPPIRRQCPLEAGQMKQCHSAFEWQCLGRTSDGGQT